MYETLLYSVDNGIATITLNRPDVYNALNSQLKRELLDALDDASNDSAVRTVILTGKGKAFSSGQDLKEALELSKNAKIDFRGMIQQGYNPIIRAMRSLPKPIVVGINGVAAGAGLSLALAADIRIMSTDARLVEGFTGIALVPDSGGTYFFSRLMNYAQAFEFAALNEPMDAQTALERGLVNRVISASEFESAVYAFAERLASAPTKTLGLVKMMLQKAAVMTLDDVLDMEAEMQEIAGNSEDCAIGLAAFVAKQAPKFIGR
ncbi:MAG: enoyl-CoA hydratase-related protein [Bacteroidota bacterium]|nr:enoyl-CoA hydratase-related protein [Candidatus Kapabacteria bacterium]MDW8220178.1 enoyl-CoA hydratase-related protein [Bacteroidota bacterium]